MNEEELNDAPCEENGCTPKYYEFYEEGHRYHGYECEDCGKLLQTG